MDTDEDVIPEGASVLHAEVMQPFNRYQGCVVEVSNYWMLDTYVLERACFDACGWGREVYLPGTNSEPPEYEFVSKTLTEVLDAVRSATDPKTVIERVLRDHDNCIDLLTRVYEHRDASVFEHRPTSEAEWQTLFNEITRLRIELAEATA